MNHNWEISYIDVSSMDGEPLDVCFNYVVDTVEVEDRQVVNDKAYKNVQIDRVTRYSANRLQKVLSNLNWDITNYFYPEGVIIEYRRP